MDDFDEVIKEFLVESYESLDQLDRDLIALEDAPDDRDRLASIFRTVHTIKGTSGFLAFPKLERVAHVGENLLVPLRDGALRLNHDIADGLLGMVDAIRNILAHIESDSGEGDTDYDDLVTQLEELLSGEPVEAAAVKTVDTSETNGSASAESISDTELTEVVEELKATARPSASIPAPQQGKQQSTPAAMKSSGPSKDGTLADSTVRIDVELLDKLMNLVGELVLARNQILQFGSCSDDSSMAAASQRLNLITSELQEGVMKTRMQPIRNAWSKLPRVVRDLSSSCGKSVVVKMEGADTELDKTILEAIKDPLTHIVRNSVDHGIEMPDVREAVGKPGEGTLCLRAYHEGGLVNIEISDDGGGIDVNRVRAKAVEKGLITEAQAAELSERDATNLILLPGFSTAAEVTNVSGRGVGMDVVKTNIERISGSLEIQSTPGEGTTLRIKIPLTLAIVPALIVRSHGDQYAIPQVSLVELVRLDGSRVAHEIEYIHDVPVYRLRGNLLPLVYLEKQLELEPRDDADEDSVNIVVLQAEDRQFGLVVDSITDTQEIVVKPLGQFLKKIPAYAGSTIMGDGSVALILDVLGIAERANVLAQRSEHPKRGAIEQAAGSEQVVPQSLLVVDPGDGTHLAVRLSTVARLEEFQPSDIERTAHSEVVQYRGQIMPLVRLAGCGSQSDENGKLQVVVFTSAGRSFGVVVGRIVDIVEHAFTETDSTLPGRHVVQGRVTELVDLEDVVRAACPAALDQPAA